MGIEAATFISDLVAANPGAADLRSQGDDHLRLLKAVLQASFPTSSKAFYNPTTQSKSANFTVVASDMNKTFVVSTGAGAVTMTLPSLGAGDAGWECWHYKSTGDTNPVFVAPPSGTVVVPGIFLTFSKVRRCIPFARIRSFWDGTAWIIHRADGIGGPVGSCIEFHGISLPVGYEWPSGQTLSSAANYPEYNAILGSVGTRDRRGTVGVGADNLGGVAAGRLGAIIAGTVLGTIGGAETVALSIANLASHTHTGTTNTIDRSLDHNHLDAAPRNKVGTSGGGGAFFGLWGDAAFGSSTTVASGGINSAPSSSTNLDHLHTFTTDVSGSGTAHNNLQPSTIVNFILVVE